MGRAVDAVPLEDGKEPLSLPDFAELHRVISEALVERTGVHPGIAGLNASLLLRTSDHYTLESYPCKHCGIPQFFKLAVPDVKAALQGVENLLNRLVGKPKETVEHQHREVPLNELTDQELLDRIGRAGSSG